MTSISPINMGNNLYDTAQTETASAAQATKTTAQDATAQAAITGQEDSVQLSAAARAKLLQKESQGVTTNAASYKTTNQTVIAVQEDPVNLSAAAQAKLLHKEGQSVTNIAAAFGATTATVDSYLGITVTSIVDQALQAAEAATTTKA